ncbi:SMG7-like protein [Tanacetum coccineum]
MIIPMNNTLGKSSREHAQRLYDKNAELESKLRKAAQARVPSDPSVWQQMRENLETILVEDHDFSEQHDIEFALWQLHYKRIEDLRAHLTAAQASAAQNGKGAARPGPDRITKIRSMGNISEDPQNDIPLSKVCMDRAKYGLSIGYISEDPQNDISLSRGGEKSIDVKKGLLSCHRCFIYLGDLARYKGLYGEGASNPRDFATAASYYKQAATLWPSSGNPHHQLAILASYSGDVLLTAYLYFRSLAVDTPFTTARDNLIIAFEKNRQSYCQLLADSKAAPTKKVPARMTGKGRNRCDPKNRKTDPLLVEERELTVPETFKAFSIRFVRLNGILFTRTSLETFGEVFSVARGEFLRLLSSGGDELVNFGSDLGECKLFITRFIAIMIFTVHNASKETENQSYAEILQRSVVLQNAFTAIFDFMALIVERCFQLNDPSASFLLPGIMIFVEWLACCPDLVGPTEMEERQATARSLFWNHFVSFLNKILSEMVNGNEDETCFVNMSRYDEGETANRLALPEDIELRGFLPLAPAHLILDFSRTNYFGGDGGNKEKNARVQRILAAGKALTTRVRVGHQGIYFDSKTKKFFFGVEPQYISEVSAVHITENEEGEEEEDEVIVFKPSVPEKHTPVLPSIPLSSEVTSRSDAASMAHGAFSSEPLASSVNGNMQYSELAQPNTSKWMVGEEEIIGNGLSQLTLLGNGFPARPEWNTSSGMLRSDGFGASNEQSFQDAATVIPSKFDSVMTSGSGFNSIPSKTKFNKSPVSRPIRHIGPPPGFNTAVSKYMDEPAVEVNLRNANPNTVLDDYSWLDGYQLPNPAYSGGFGNSFNCLPQPKKLLNTNKTSLGMECFPFPGKQVSSVQGDVGIGIGKQYGNGNVNGWLDYQIPQQPILYQEPLKRGNEQFIVPPQQYQGQSLWEGYEQSTKVDDVQWPGTYLVIRCRVFQVK